MERMSRKDFEILETRMIVYTRDFFTCRHRNCFVCGSDNIQLAHRIAQTEANKKYVQQYWLDNFDKVISLRKAERILHHPLNLATSCIMHNSYFNVGHNPEKRKIILDKIHSKNEF